MNRRSDDIEEENAYFRSDRIFYHAEMDGSMAGWYISMRGGNDYGPFPDKHVANTILESVVKRLDKRKENYEGEERRKMA